ncbi:MAG: rhomboid family intramembrane serine protease [Bacteroidetes bacterium]|nr:rhomboid family intramembrane serine protease [Bacteroidota bacterium]MDA0887963.1 rhomboid family intramembrane serine protease [Bacteroidota bacterium]MDA1083917.1 rhomboid family intramembrane serine protease [Bacteroidota bacterium]
MRNIPDIVKHLIILNVLIFIGSQFVGELAYDVLALHYPKNDLFGIWQVFTHMFMHGSISHILFNMFGLWMFGSPLAQMWGKNKFLFFYLSTGVGAAALQLLVYHLQIQGWVEDLVAQGFVLDEIYASLQQQTQSLFHVRMVGASGALYGVLVAFAFMFPNAELMMIFLPIPIKAKYFVPLVLVMDLFFGFSSYSMGPIAHFAHVGGAVTGFLIMWYWKRNQFNQNRWS